MPQKGTKGAKPFSLGAVARSKSFCAFCAFLWLILMAAIVCAQKKSIPVDPNKFVLIINGPGGEIAYAQQFEEWTSQLRSALTEKFEFDAKNIRVLSEKADAGSARA